MALKKVMKQMTSSSKMSTFITLSLIAAIIVLIVFVAINARTMYKNKKYKDLVEREKENETERFSDKPLFQIIYAYHKTCPHCIKFNDTFDLVAKAFAQNVNSHDTEVMKIERGNLDEKYAKYVDGFPTVLIFKDREYKTKLVGNNSSQEFGKFLEDALISP